MNVSSRGRKIDELATTVAFQEEFVIFRGVTSYVTKVRCLVLYARILRKTTQVIFLCHTRYQIINSLERPDQSVYTGMQLRH